MDRGTFYDVIKSMAKEISARDQNYKYMQWIPMVDKNYGRSRYINAGINVYTTPELYGRDTSHWIIDESHKDSTIDWRKINLGKTISPFKATCTRKDINIEEFDRLLMGDEDGSI